MEAKFTFFLNNVITKKLISARKSLVVTCDGTAAPHESVLSTAWPPDISFSKY